MLTTHISSCAALDKSDRGFFFVVVINVFHRGPYGPPIRRNMSRWVQSPLEWVSLPEIQSQPIATYDLLGGASGPPVSPLDPHSIVVTCLIFSQLHVH